MHIHTRYTERERERGRLFTERGTIKHIYNYLTVPRIEIGFMTHGRVHNTHTAIVMLRHAHSHMKSLYCII